MERFLTFQFELCCLLEQFCFLAFPGGGGNQSGGSGPVPTHAADVRIPGMAGIVKEASLIDMAARGELVFSRDLILRYCIWSCYKGRYMYIMKFSAPF